MVGDEDRRPGDRHVVDALELETGVRHERRPRELHRQPLQLEPDDGIFITPGDTSRLSTGQRRALAITAIRGSGLTTIGYADRREQRSVVRAVGVGVALVEVDVVLLGPLA